MNAVRPPAVAGMFYPADPRELRQEVADLLAQASQPPADSPVPKAIIAPHAGYIYSGPVAATAYARLQPAKGQIQRVVLFGPSHRVALLGLATCSTAYYHTPLGNIPIDTAAVESISSLPQVKCMDQAHSLEHSLEVHLPFLQMVLEDFTLVPVVAGEASPQQVAEVLEKLWGGPETLIVISSDLSHYHDYETARRMDSATSKAIEMLQLEDVDSDHACGRVPVNGLLYYARTHGLHAETIDLRNSGDTAGPRDQVVGYGAYIFH